MIPFHMAGKRKYEAPYSRPFPSKWPRGGGVSGGRSRPPPQGNFPSPISYLGLGITFDNPYYQSTLIEYGKLRRRVVSTRYIDDEVLSKLGLQDDVRYLFDRLGWCNLMYAREHTYERLTLEFLCSLNVEIFEGDDVEKGKVSFQLMGQKFDFSLAEFNRVLDVPVVEGGDRKTPKSFQEELFWFKLTGLSYNRSDSCSSSIQNPCFRYVHRVLSQTIFGRTLGADKVRVDELYLMYCMVEGHKVDTGAFLATHLMNVARSKGKEILIGGLVTYIARKLGLEFSDLPVVQGSESLDLSACVGMRMVEKEDERYNWLLEDRTRGVIVRFPLPNVERTTIRVESNWLFPLHDYAPRVSRPREPVADLGNASLSTSERIDIAALFQEQKRQGTLLESLVSMVKEVRDWQLRHDSSLPLNSSLPPEPSLPPESSD